MSLNNEGGLTAAIHQPNFFPWLGYFHKIMRADRFVFMDNVQFPRTSRGTWINRVRFLVNGTAHWITCPVNKADGIQLIKDVTIDDTQPWREKLLRTAQHSYRKAPCFNEIYPLFRDLVEFNTMNLAAFNMNAIRSICSLLDINLEKLVLGSTISASGQATDLLIEMTKATGCSAYLCGGGAGGYQEDDKFSAGDVGLVYQNFKHPTYSQMGSCEFMPGLSIMDALFNLGAHATTNLLKTR